MTAKLRDIRGRGQVFFDDYPLFYETSETAVEAQRLNLRHYAMIEHNHDILAGARVLDLASHDGRWSFAALKAGAAHVTGVEARRELVENARKTFADYGVPSDTYNFIRGDMFRVLARREFHVDVVMCFGFVYHTLRYPELFRAIMDVKPRHVLLDTKVIRGDKPMVRLKINKTGVQSNAAPDQTSHARRAIAGWPSVSALSMMLDIYGLEVEEQYDWPALLAAQAGGPKHSLGDYRTGHRVTLRCRARPEATLQEPRRPRAAKKQNAGKQNVGKPSAGKPSAGKPSLGKKRRRDGVGAEARPRAQSGGGRRRMRDSNP